MRVFNILGHFSRFLCDLSLKNFHCVKRILINGKNKSSRKLSSCPIWLSFCFQMLINLQGQPGIC